MSLSRYFPSPYLVESSYEPDGRAACKLHHSIIFSLEEQNWFTLMCISLYSVAAHLIMDSFKFDNAFSFKKNVLNVFDNYFKYVQFTFYIDVKIIKHNL